MSKTNQELWEEALRTAETLLSIEPTLEPMHKAMFKSQPLNLDKLPVDYVSDAQILTQILLKLKARGARIA